MQSDEYGKYRVEERWVRAWKSSSFYVAGFSVEELRVYENGSFRICRCKEPVYIHEHPELEFVHKVYLAAQEKLFAAAKMPIV